MTSFTNHGQNVERCVLTTDAVVGIAVCYLPVRNDLGGRADIDLVLGSSKSQVVEDATGASQVSSHLMQKPSGDKP